MQSKLVALESVDAARSANEAREPVRKSRRLHDQQASESEAEGEVTGQAQALRRGFIDAYREGQRKILRETIAALEEILENADEVEEEEEEEEEEED